MISLILVNYKVANLLADAVKSIYDSNCSDTIEIIVIDNHSEDNSEALIKSKFPAVKWIQNTTNTGFAHAVNQGIQIANGEFLVLMNPDSILEPTCISELTKVLKSDPKIGIIGGKVLNTDGSIQKQCRRNIPTLKSAVFRLFGLSVLFPSNRITKQYELDLKNDLQCSDIQAVSGSLMAFPKEIAMQIEGFDEGFFLFGEDLDFCLRTSIAGYRIVYCPSAVATHLRGESRKKRPILTLWHTHSAMARFYRKHLARNHPFAIRVIVWIGIWCHWAGCTFLEVVKFAIVSISGKVSV